MSKSTTKDTPAPAAAKGFPVISTTVGATVDSFYRSAMNSKLNASLTGKTAPLFPNMHVQTPIRILYLNGIKNIRVAVDGQRDRVKQATGWNSTAVGMSLAIAPGLLMVPMSSLLEASNAGHMNSEPLVARSMRGLMPRSVREIIFAIGLNQMSDFYQRDMWPRFTDNVAASNILGSMTAGIVSGYISHVPHNLSTLKLLKPHLSYGEHFQSLVNRQTSSNFAAAPAAIATESSASLLSKIWKYASVFLTPKGVLIRTGQIVGSFIIVNGTIGLFDAYGINSTLPAFRLKAGSNEIISTTATADQKSSAKKDALQY